MDRGIKKISEQTFSGAEFAKTLETVKPIFYDSEASQVTVTFGYATDDPEVYAFVAVGFKSADA